MLCRALISCIFLASAAAKTIQLCKDKYDIRQPLIDSGKYFQLFVAIQEQSDSQVIIATPKTRKQSTFVQQDIDILKLTYNMGKNVEKPICITADKHYVVGYNPSNSLAQLLSNNKRDKVAWSQTDMRTHLAQLANAIYFLDKQGVPFPNLTPSNIMVSYQLQFSTFGLLGLDHDTRYMEPELKQKQEWSPKAILWSIGLILYEMHYYELPKINGQGKVVFPLWENPKSEMSAEMKFLIKVCVKPRAKRISVAEFVTHVSGMVSNAPSVKISGHSTVELCTETYTIEAVHKRTPISTIYMATNEFQQQVIVTQLVTTKTGKRKYDVAKEMKILTLLKRPRNKYVQELICYQETPGMIQTVMAYNPMETLASFLPSTELEEDVVRNYLFHITQALKRLQDKDISHPNLNPWNILLAADGTLQLTDYGILGMTLSKDAEEAEVYQKDNSVVWSIGMMLFKMFHQSAQPGFHSNGQVELPNDDKMSPEMRELITACLASQQERIDLIELIRKAETNLAPWTELAKGSTIDLCGVEYTARKKIGSGPLGKVWKAEDKNHKKYAIKEMVIPKTGANTGIKLIKRETRVWKNAKTRNPKVGTFHCAKEIGPMVYVVLEYYEKGPVLKQEKSGFLKQMTDYFTSRIEF